MNKIYQRIDWENYPSSATPLNEDNLNKMDYAIDKLDDRIVTHETTKLNTATGNTLVKNVTFNEKTGVFTIEKLNGSKITINTALEKISTNFHFNPTTQKLVLTLIDGTVQEIDLSALITQYEFLESDTITFEIDASGKVKANILNGSITGEKLEPNYLANVTLQANNAKTSADNAKTSEELAYQYAEEAKESASQTAKSDAKNITYDNTESGLSATNVKDALDEVAQGSVSAIATDTTITDSTNAPLVRLKVKGKTEQFTTSGKNLVENTATTQTVGGVTFTVNDDGSVTANGTATEDAILTIWRHPKIKKGGRYILSGNTSEKFMLKLTLAWGGSNHYFTSNGEEIEFTVDGDITTSSLQFIIPSGEKANNFTFYPMIREATITDATYEPFTNGASPNPDYPQEINGLAKDGAIEVKTTEKNIFGGLTFAQAFVDSGSNNVVLNEGEKTVTFQQNTNYEDVFDNILYDKFKENTQYTFITTGTSTSESVKGSNILCCYTNGTKEWISVGVPYVTREELSVKSFLYHFQSVFGVTLNYEKCGIFEGVITADEFEPYTETTAAIPTDAPLYEGDYLEVYADGSGKLVRAMAKVVFDGSADEEWNQSSEGTIYYTILNDAKYSGSDNNVNNVQGLCSHFTMLNSYSNAIIKGYGYCGFGVVSSLSKTMVGMNSSLATTNEWKTWLQSNPVTVVYELAEPTETPLTAEQVAEFKKLYTFEPVTNVLCDGEVEIQYYKNTPSGVAVGTVHRMANDEKATYDGDGNVITETYAKKSIYGDTTINVGRREGSTVGDCSTAEGYNNTAKGKYSHSEGVSTTAIGNASHSEGNSTTAIGDYAHSEGDNTIANGRSQHVQGKYNVEDTEDKYAHIVGGGTYEERKNIHTLDWNGNAEFAGSVKCSNVLKTLTECEASTTSTDIAGASALAELNDSLKTENSACTEFEEYNTAVNTTWTNNLYYKNQIIDCTLVIRLNALTANTAYNIFAIPSGYQPPAEIHKMYITHFGTKVLVTFRPTNTIIIKPLSDITTNTEILYIHETWIQI